MYDTEYFQIALYRAFILRIILIKDYSHDDHEIVVSKDHSLGNDIANENVIFKYYSLETSEA